MKKILSLILAALLAAASPVSLSSADFESDGFGFSDLLNDRGRFSISGREEGRPFLKQNTGDSGRSGKESDSGPAHGSSGPQATGAAEAVLPAENKNVSDSGNNGKEVTAGTAASTENNGQKSGEDFFSRKKKKLSGLWKNAENDVETGNFQEKNTILPPSLRQNAALLADSGAEPLPLSPQIEFRDSGTSLNVTGRKLISINYSGKRFMKEQTDTTRDRSSGSFEIQQEMQVKMSGKVGEKISVNIDYDDTKTDKQDISVVYTGTTDEIVKQVVFGDIDLSLPSTEFVSYNKQLFGIRADMKAGGFGMTVVASRTKGETKTKQFKGNTEFQKTDIYDTAYIRRRYYDVTFGHTGQFTIKSNTEKIYIDRQSSEPVDNITVFEMTAEDYEIPATTYTGRFRQLKRGVDYVMDYANGIVKFSGSLASNAVVIIDYERSDGMKLSDTAGTPGMYKILKPKDDNYSTEAGRRRELKTYYSIGTTNIVRDNSAGNFSLQVQDLSHNEVGSSLNPKQTYSDTIEVDFEQGTFHLLRPFGSPDNPNIPDPQVYAASPSSKRLFHIEYSFKFKTFTLDSNIVPDSESVRLNGRKLTKNNDYYIDYDSGFITFYNPDRIGSDSIIDISYEVSEFGGTGTQSMVGGRASYDLGNIFSIGSTVLYQGGSKGSSVPEITEIANSNLVYEADMQLKNIKLGALRASAGVEAAFSKTTPNLDNYAIVENLESSRVEDSVPMDKTYWAIAANPTQSPADPESVAWDNESVKLLDINPQATTDGSQEVLTLDYDFTLSDEVSIVYPLSYTGLDFSTKATLEFVVWGDNNESNAVDFNIDFGQMNEDADDTGGQTLTCSSGYQALNNPKTEDINCDGQVSSSEDIGWLYAPAGKHSRRYGAANGRLDTADLNRNGRLDGEELAGSFGYNSPYGYTDFDWNGTVQTSKVNFSGWRTLTVPMGITSDQTYKWNAVKQVRISLRKIDGVSKTRGRIKIARITAVGNTWNINESTGTGKLAVAAVNNVDNTDYTPIYRVPGDPSSVFDKLYGSVSDLKKKNNLETVSEQALRVIYSSFTSADNGYVYRTWSQSVDMGQHRYFKFLLRNDTENANARAYLKAGSTENYFRVSIPLDFTGWRLIELEQYDETGDDIPDYWINRSRASYNVQVSSAGTPGLQSISQLILGIEINGAGEHSGILYLDDIYVEEPIIRNGSARKAEATFELPGWFKGGGKYLYTDRSFQTPVTSVTNQDREYTNGWLDITRIRFFPVNLKATRETTVTPNASVTGESNLISTLMEGHVKKFDGKASGVLTLPSLPKMTFTYTKATTDYNTLSRTDDRDLYESQLDYSTGRNLYILPKEINATYSLAKNIIDYRPDNLASLTNVYDMEETTEFYSGKLTFMPWKGSNIIPTYSRKTVKEQRTPLLMPEASEKYPKALEQKAGFTSSLKFTKWLVPAFNYSISTEESNNISTNTVTVGTSSHSYRVGEIKTVTRSARGGASLTLNMNDIIPSNKLFKSMVISASYTLEDGDSWYYVEKEYDSTKHLWLRNRMKPKNSQALLNTLTNRDTYNASFRWQPLSAYKFTETFSPLRTFSITNNFIKTKQHSEVTATVTDTSNLTLPDTVLSISQLENLIMLKRWVNNMSMNLKYSRNIAGTKNISETVTDNYSADIRGKVLNKIDSALSYIATRSDITDTETNKTTEKNSSDSLSLQGTFDWKKARVTPKIDYTRTVKETTMGIKTAAKTVMTPSLMLKTDFSLPKGLRLPFMKKAIVLDNKIVYTGTLSYAMSSSPITASENNNLLSFNSSMDYEVTKNLRITLNAGVQRYWAKKIPEDDYMSYEIGSTVSFQF